MKEEIVPLIRELAQELGVATEYLWSVMVNQAPVYVVAVVATFLIILCIICVLVVALRNRAKKYGSLEKAIEKDEEILAFLYTIILSILTVILVILTLISVSPVITALLNPEYWALEQILEKI